MIYCNNCVLPSTRPNLTIGKDGICDACKTSIIRPTVDWPAREREFQLLVDQTKDLQRQYDCVIPVSGGKDSTWQTIKALEYGLNPLCVTWRTPARNSLGEQNLRNLIDLGVNHIDFSINPSVERAFTKKAFERFGIPLIPMHMALHAIPLQVAVNYRIPLIIWGENSATEYGGEQDDKGVRLTRAWLKKFGVTNGTTAEDWYDDELTESSMRPYYWPTEEEQLASDTKAVFLGHFFQWDPQHTYEVAKKHGFEAGIAPKTGLYNYADIDDEFLITIHHWMKWFKFGFTRLWDNLSIEIRNGRITRDEAIKVIRETEEGYPEAEIEKFADYTGWSQSEIIAIAEGFRNADVWKQNGSKPFIEGFLIDDWKW